MGDINKAFEVPEGLSLDDLTAIFTGTLAPDSNSEVAPIGSIYLRSNGEVWAKIGSGNSDWIQLQKIPHTATSNPLATNDGADTASVGREFQVGDIWINTTLDATFICVDNTTSNAIWDRQVRQKSVELTDGATITIDCSKGNHFYVDTIGGNRTLTWTNLYVGWVGKLTVTQDATGSRTLSATASKFQSPVGNSFDLSEDANAVDVINMESNDDATRIMFTVSRDFSDA